MRALAVTAAAVALAATACGNSDNDDSGSAAPAPVTTTSAAAATTTAAPPPVTATTPAATTPEATPSSTRCHTSELGVTITEADAAAGNRYAKVVLKNTSQRECTVYGYGGLQPLDAAHKAITVSLARNATQGGPRLVTLKPGSSVARTLHWTVVPTGESACPKGAYAEVTPPDETDHVTVKYQFADICGAKMDGTPFGVTLG